MLIPSQSWAEGTHWGMWCMCGLSPPAAGLQTWGAQGVIEANAQCLKKFILFIIIIIVPFPANKTCVSLG